MLFPSLGLSSLLVVVAQLTKGMQTEQLLCWSSMTDTEHNKTSSSNEKDFSMFWPIFVEEVSIKLKFVTLTVILGHLQLFLGTTHHQLS